MGFCVNKFLLSLPSEFNNNRLIKKKVILIESNPGIAASFRAWVDELFLETDISVVPSFEEFLVETKKIQPDFIIADINLPGINGPQAIQKMKENGVIANAVILANLSEFDTFNQHSFKRRVSITNSSSFPRRLSSD